ncbi:hypothetical protein SVTN_40070 (plasmid) [Streptomyces vietnamensis]|uniref:Uncharacterized protein n=1 Tax=Streptomyces vietnamensis TaxID=362257 RepID=A0A0B5IPN7_9ACTN|nr:hypothetical protein SVTN_40070 [Streptomyces vietnamensis]
MSQPYWVAAQGDAVHRSRGCPGLVSGQQGNEVQGIAPQDVIEFSSQAEAIERAAAHRMCRHAKCAP